MDKKEIINSLSTLGDGEIFLGVVGAVRTGKSTFIKKFIENLVIPNIKDDEEKQRCLDEMPHSASGKQIMTIEPKFVPSSGAVINIDTFDTKIKLIDCVGYIVDGSKGFADEEGNPRMVKSPWFSEEIPFHDAATIGTEKVIKDHSTIGIVLTTDGSFGEISRESFISAEENIINELKEIDKPFIILMNSKEPGSEKTKNMCQKLSEKYDKNVLPINAENLNELEIMKILKEALYEFPVKEVNVNIPDWVAVLEDKNEIKKEYINKIKECVTNINKLRDVTDVNDRFTTSENIKEAYISNVNTKTGEVVITLEAPNDLYDKVLKEEMGISINSKSELLKMLQDFRNGKNEYDLVSDALKQVKATGYGIISPTISDMTLETPEVIKEGNKYGIKLKAKASSIHMVKVDVESTFEPIIGTEAQSKEFIEHILENENDIWKSEIFGRDLETIVKEGIQVKLLNMPDKTKYKLIDILTKIINKGSNNLIAIVI